MGAIEGGAHASKTTAWRAKQEVITMSETEYNYSYQIIKPFLASAGENVPSAGAGAGSGEARRGDDGEPATPLRRSIRRKL